MALADYKLNYTKKWTSAADFPTYENREEQVRADIQLLFDEMATAFNAFLDVLAASLVPFTPSDAVPENNVQAAIENVQQQAAAASAGTIPERSLDGNKLKLKAITASEVDDGAIGKTQMAAGSVDNTILAADAVRASHVKDGELTLDKFASGALDEKADLANGIIARAQRRWRVNINPAGNSSFTLAVDNAETALVLSNSIDLTITIPAHSDVEIPVGSSILVVRGGTADVTIAPATGVTLQYPPNGTGSFTMGKVYSLVVLLKTANNSWAAVILPGLLDDGDVTHAKLANNAVESNNIKDGAVVDGKLGANSVNAGDIKSGAVSTEYEVTIPAKYQTQESAWEESGSSYVQEIAVPGLVSGTAVTVTADSEASAAAIAALANITFEAGGDKLTATSSAEVSVDIPIDIVQSGNNYDATLPAEKTIDHSYWNCDGPPYTQEVEVSGLVPEDPEDASTTVTWTCNSSDEAVLAAYDLLTLTAGTDIVAVSASAEVDVDVPVIAVQNSVPYSFTIPAAGYSPQGVPYKQTVAVSGLLATDKPIIDLVMSGTYATDESRDEAWSNVYRAVPGEDSLTFYSKEELSVDLPVHILCVRK